MQDGHDHRRRDAAGPEVRARLLLRASAARRSASGRPRVSRARAGLPAPRGRPALRPALRAGALLLAGPLARARRARSRSCSRRFCRRGRRGAVRPTDPFRRGLPLSPRQAGGADLARRRRARAQARPASRAIGHSGTLDPMATGLLLLCAGGAARLQSFFTLMDKSYDGVDPARPRDDDLRPRGRDRRPRARRRRQSRAEEIEAAAAAFRGEFLQSPPPYSAKKVGGRKFYEMARKGESVPVAAQEGPRLASSRFGALDGRAAPLLDLLLLGHLHPLDRERARREARLRGAPGVAPPDAHRRVRRRRRGRARAIRGACRPPSGSRRPTPSRSRACLSRSSASGSRRSRPGRSARASRSRRAASPRGRATGSRSSDPPTTWSRSAR